MQRVLVIDKHKQPLMPCHPARARELLRKGKAAVFRRYPFTIVLTEREGGEVQPVAFKIDPGSKQTGMALVTDFQRGKRLIWAAMLEHRGQQIKNALESRRALRRGRRNRHTRYRPARFDNRHTDKDYLPPSLQSRVENVWTWLCRLNRLCPLDSVSQELVRFDMQLMQKAEISGVEYQQGELLGYEVREYLLEKWGRKCAYCGAKDTPLEVEHIMPNARGGSNRISNLTIACKPCNQAKNTQTAAEFGHPEVQKQAKQPLKDAAAVNATRWALYHRLETTGLPVEVGTGGRTKFNRAQQGYPKAH
jgi:5-methylcytosine-specific restriction endonuclease McrA